MINITDNIGIRAREYDTVDRERERFIYYIESVVLRQGMLELSYCSSSGGFGFSKLETSNERKEKNFFELKLLL